MPRLQADPDRSRWVPITEDELGRGLAIVRESLDAVLAAG